MNTWRETGRLAGETFASLKSSKSQVAAVLAVLAALVLLVPDLAFVFAILGAVLLLKSVRARQPDILSQALGPKIADKRTPGIYPIGVDALGREYLYNKDEARCHFTVFGETGTERTGYLLGLVEGMVEKGSGLIYVEGRGDVTVPARLWEMASRHGREDDFLFLNLQRTSDERAPSALPHTHSFNPFSHLEPDQIVSLLMAMIADDDIGSIAYRKLSSGLATIVVDAMAWRRKVRGRPINVVTLLPFFKFEAVLDLADPSGSVGSDLPPKIRRRVVDFLSLLAGYNFERGKQQSSSTEVHFRSIAEPIVRQLQLLEGVMSDCPEAPAIDIMNVIRDNRILVVLLPGLDGSVAETSAAGRLITAAVASGAANFLNAPPADPEYSGTGFRKNVFPIVFDEAGSFVSRSMVLLAAQARSVGLSLVYGAADALAMSARDPQGADAVMANSLTNIVLHQGGGMTTTIRQIAIEMFRKPNEHPSQPSRSAFRLSQFLELAQPEKEIAP